MHSQRRNVTTILSAAVASRVATVALMVLANSLLPTHDATGVHKFRPSSFPVPSRPTAVDSSSGSGGGRGGGVGGGGGRGILSAFTRWDAAWFLSIADAGYPGGRSRSSSSAADLDTIEAVDCVGTGRAWGGEDYYYEYASDAEKGSLLDKEGDKEREEGGGEGEEEQQQEEEKEARSSSQRRRCRADIPLEEQAHAFFPLYPWLVRWGAAALRAGLAQAGLDLGGAESLILAAVLISNLSFVVAAVLLYHLGSVVTGDALLAFRGALAFCATPASVFFSTAYTESLYAALSFAGLLVLFSEGRRRRSRGRIGADASDGDAAAKHGSISISEGGNVGSGSNTYSGSGSSNSSSKIGTSSNNCGEIRNTRWWWWWSGALNAWIAAAFLSLATLTRSNGIAGAGVLILEKLRWMADDAGLFASSGTAQGHPSPTWSYPTRSASTEKRAQDDGRCDGDGCGGSVSGSEIEHREPRSNTILWLLRLAACAVVTVLQALLVIAPYVLVQVHAYRKFCGGGRAGLLWGGDSERNFSGTVDSLTAELHPWCAWQVPSVYSYVQSTYWGVGPLKYYEWKQIPNFLLAAPALALTALGTARFISAQLQGSPASGSPVGGKQETRGNTRNPWASREGWPWRFMQVFFGSPRLPSPDSSPFERSAAASLVVQWAFLGVFSALCMNVQVVTRFLAAACPPLHWWTAGLLVRRGGIDAGNAAASDGSRAVGTALRWYFVLYFVVGAVLHPNFLPWT